MKRQDHLDQIAEAVKSGDKASTIRLVEHSLADGTPALEILNMGLKRGMQEVGDCFARLEVYLPEMMMSAEAMKGALIILEPELQRLTEESEQGSTGSLPACSPPPASR